MATELDAKAAAVGEGDSQELAQPIGETAEERQPKRQPKMVSEEDVRKLQAIKDKETAAALQRAQQAEQKALAFEQKMRQIENQMYELSLRDRPEDEQQLARLQRRMEEIEAARLQAQTRAEAAEQWAQGQQQVFANLTRISQKTGFSFEEGYKLFQEGKTADEIWEVAADHYADQRRKKRRSDDDDDDEDVRAEKAARNRTDLGEGRGSKSADDFETLLRKARESGSSVSLAKLSILEAQRQRESRSRQ